MSMEETDPTEKAFPKLDGSNVPENFSIPSCGIEDVDRALFKKFDKEIGFAVKSKDGLAPVPVLFAGGERFAMSKRKKPVRDRNGVLILPLITIHRTEIDQSKDLGGLGRGLGQESGEIVVRTRLDERDRNYQRIRNKLGLDNQPDVASSKNLSDTSEPQGSDEDAVATRRSVGENASKVWRGSVLEADLTDNIMEIITIPFPEYFKSSYEVTFWTQHIQHMNTLIETMMSAYNPQYHYMRLDSGKGYWFVAFVDPILKPDNNFTDYSEAERLVRYTFGIQAVGYIIAPRQEGKPSPFRRYVSAPQIAFGVLEGETQVQSRRPLGAGSGDPSKFTLSDVEELDKQGVPIVGRNHSTDTVLDSVVDPFTGKVDKKYVRVLTRNQRAGETVARLSEVDEFLTP